MRDRNDEDMIRFNGIEKFKGKIAQQALPNITSFDGPGFGILNDPFGRFPYFTPKSLSEPFRLNLVVIGGVFKFPGRIL